MRFLVTGGAGFLGSALSNQLVAGDHEVRVIDNLSAGDSDRLDPRVLFTRGDVADIPKLWTLLQDVHCVYHLAARVSVPESIKYPRDYNHVNVGGTVSVMEAIRDAGVQRVVLASSGAVYGEQQANPLTEDLIPDPDSPYAVSKLAAEAYVKTIGKLWGIETVILRIFNAYGPGQQLPASHAPVIPRFIKAAQSGGSLVVFGEGAQTRDFIYIDDVVSALIVASTATGVDRQIINVGSGVETSIRTLASVIAQVTDTELDVVYNSGQSGGVNHMCASIDQARSLLGIDQPMSLADGIRQTLETDPRFQPVESSAK
nr:NAD-dependent epimerase/dehydratase family protein [Anaerolineae bacterium]